MRATHLSLSLALCAVCVGSAAAQAEKDPVFRGKKVSDWIKTLETSPVDAQRSNAASTLAQIGPVTKEVVPSLVKALDDKAVTVRRAAMQAIFDMELPAKEAVPACLKAVQDKDESVRVLAAAVLAEVGSESKDVFPALMKAADDPSLRVRPNAVKALKEMELSLRDALDFFAKAVARNGDSVMQDAAFIVLARHSSAAANEAVPVMLKAIDNPAIFETTRSRIVLALGQMGPEGAKPAIPHLRKLVRGPEPFQRDAAVAVLGQIGPDAKEAIPELLDALGERSNNFRIAVLGTLGKIGPADPKVVAAVAGRFFDDGNDSVRGAAGKVLTNFGPAAVPILTETFKKGKQRLAIAEILGAIGSPAKDAVPAMCEYMIADEHHVHRKMMAATLAQIGAREAVPALTKLLSDPLVRSEMASALAKIGPGAEALPALRQAYKDSDWGVRPNIVLAIGAIGPAGKEAVPFLITVMTEQGVPMAAIAISSIRAKTPSRRCPKSVLRPSPICCS